MLVTSKITGKTYNPDRCWFIVNPRQIDLYNSNGADREVLDVIYDRTKYKFIFVYPKNKFMAELYDKFCKYELSIEE